MSRVRIPLRPFIFGEKMGKQVCKISVRQLYGEPQVIGWCYDGGEVAPILRLNGQYKIKGLPMFMVEAIPHVDVDLAVEIAKIGNEFDELT